MEEIKNEEVAKKLEILKSLVDSSQASLNRMDVNSAYANLGIAMEILVELMQAAGEK